MTAGLLVTGAVAAYTAQSQFLLQLIFGNPFGIWVLFIAQIAFFLKSTALYWIITYAGVLIFVGLIAWDTQKIKRLTAQATDETSGRRIAILGSLMLYLDFINLFLFLLRIFGKRN